jgi:hypothetical protein
LHIAKLAKPYAIFKMQRGTPASQYSARPMPYAIAANPYCIPKMQYATLSQPIPH